MSNNWQFVKLEDVKHPNGRAIVSGPFGSNIGRRFFVPEGVPVIRGNNLSTDMTRFIDDGFVFITKEKAKELGNCEAIPGDLIFTAAGTLGQVGIIPDKPKYSKYIISNKQLRIRLDPAKVDRLFAFYWLSSPQMVELIQLQNTGSSVPLINLSILRKLPLPLPPLPEQQAIAKVLGALDDKIELNHHMNLTLESISWSIFKELVKERGKEKSIDDVVTIVGGSTPSTTNSTFWEGGDINWATPKDLAPLQSPILLETNSLITKLGLQEISSGLLPLGTVLLSSRAPIGYLAITQIPVAINQGFIAIKCTEEVPNYFILNWLKDNMEEIIGRANGTTFLEISKSNFRPMKIFVPSPEKMRKFVETVEPLYKKIVANLNESQTLANLRDSLLPKLMRGEVRVKV
jgi:type I restriction enzyme, S subunit